LELAQDNIEIEWIFFKGAGPAVNEAISNNQIDFAFQGDLPSIVGRAAGLNTRLIMALGKANTYIIVKNDSDIYSPADLQNKRLAFHKGTNMHVSVNKILRSVGLKEQDIKFFNLDAVASIAAFHSNDLDGMFGGINLIPLVKQGHARIVYSTHDDLYSVTRTSLLVTEKFKNAYPQTTLKIVKSLLKAVQHVSDQENYERTLKTWQYANITPEVIAEDLNGYPLIEKFSPLFDEEMRSHFQASIEVATAARLIRRPVDLSSWIDSSFLDRALIDLNLVGNWKEKPALVDPDRKTEI